jgi:hypothetical protein
MKGLQHTSAFVIQFRAGAETREDPLPGRVEHVASGRTVTFESIDDLPHLLRQMLRNARGDDWSAE